MFVVYRLSLYFTGVCVRARVCVCARVFHSTEAEARAHTHTSRYFAARTRAIYPAAFAGA